MKLAVSSTGNDINSELNPRFGRCEYFILVETDDMSFEAFENNNNALSSGAGIQSASFVASKGARVVLTGNCGPKALQTFSAAGVDVLTGFSGTVRQAVEQYTAKGVPADAPPAYSAGQTDFQGGAQPSRPGRGMGMGGGRCMGGSGRGMGMGGGRKMGMGLPQKGMYAQTPPLPESKEDELRVLKEQAEYLKQQMEAITNKIKELE